MKAYITDYTNGKYWEEVTGFAQGTDAMRTVRVYRDRAYGTVRGFGGAFTEASGCCMNSLSEADREAFIEAYFGGSGLKYNLGRVPVGSCDFALGNYEYLRENEDISGFDISRDEKNILPMILAAFKKQKDLELMATPWSPPSYMKTNGEMNNGGQLKEECGRQWAEYIVRFILEYRKRGAEISMLTVQNEPAAVQTWDSCIYSAEEEGRFTAEYLGPAMREAGLGDVKIFIWDHNKEAMYDRTSQTLAVPGAAQYIGGTAFHWYTGDHFESVRVTREAFPQLELIFTEGCVEYSRFADSNEIAKAEMYAHDMIGNLNAGASGIIDWNLLLDAQGGPNHVGNYCAAPIMCTEGFKGMEKRLSYYYIGHFSRYIMRGAVNLACSRFTDKLEAAAFANPAGPDGTREYVTVLMNRSSEAITFTLTDGSSGNWITLPAHSLMTVLQ